MPLNIVWQAEVVGELSLSSVPLLEAELELAMVGDVIVDASWRVSADIKRTLTPFASAVQQYLLSPEQKELTVTLLKQGSNYSNSVWNALLRIPVGSVWTYSFLAEMLRSGPRAVAGACRNNPYAGLIPCHRVVAKNGIGGFMGCIDGEFVALKRRLLAYEADLGSKDQ